MKKKLFLYMAILSGLAFFLFTMCTTPVANGGTEVGNPKISAMLYNPGGSPAAYDKVRFYPINYNPRTGGLTKALAAAVDSTTTDAKGNYTAKLETGTYNVLAAGDSGVAYQDSITVAKDSTIHLPADTLKAPGTLRGVIRLQPGDDARTVFIIFMGTNILKMPDDSIGNFTATNMAEGTYRVRILTTLDAYVPKDTVLSIAAGKVDSLTHDIALQYTAIPVPVGLKINYDTLIQIATLIWNKSIAGRKVTGYNIYRKDLDSASFVNIKSGVKDTIFGDSTGMQDSTYEYRIAAVDSNGTEGVKGAGVSIKMVSGFKFLQSIKLDSLRDDPTAFTIAQDTTFYIAYRGNNSNGFVGVFDKTGHNIGSIGRGLFTQLYDLALDSKGNVYTADPDQNKIRKFNNKGDSISQWSAQRPTRILINAQDNLFVLCSSNPYVMTEFDTIGTTISTDTAVSFMNDIGNMVLGTDGRVFIMEEYTNRILIYNNSLAAKTIASINLGSGYPLLRAVDSLGNFYVIWDDGKYTITVHNSVGSKIAKWQPGLPFDRICFFGGKIYVLGNNAAVNMNMEIIKVFSNPF